jgi:hypothetical protein
MTEDPNPYGRDLVPISHNGGEGLEGGSDQTAHPPKRGNELDTTASWLVLSRRILCPLTPKPNDLEESSDFET